jgi:hypothetical protein
MLVDVRGPGPRIGHRRRSRRGSPLRALSAARHVPFRRTGLTDIGALDEAIAAIRPASVASPGLRAGGNDRRHSIDETTAASWDAGIAVNLAGLGDDRQAGAALADERQAGHRAYCDSASRCQIYIAHESSSTHAMTTVICTGAGLPSIWRLV